VKEVMSGQGILMDKSLCEGRFGEENLCALFVCYSSEDSKDN
jgi:hypothetical protein